MKYFLRTILLFSVICIGFGAYTYPSSRVHRLLEQEPPTISIEYSENTSSEAPRKPLGLGLKPKQINIQLKDAVAGVKEVSVELAQGQRSLPLARQEFEVSPREITFSLEIPGAPHGFIAGEATLNIKAKDNSFWQTVVNAEYKVLIDLQAPHIELLSKSHNSQHGGVALVFFRVKRDDDYSAVFVNVDNLKFPAYSAADLDPAFAKAKNVFFAFITFPYGYDNVKTPVRIAVADMVGNSSSAVVSTHIKPRKRPQETINISPSFVENPIGELLVAYDSLLRESGEPSPITNLLREDASDYPQLISRFRMVNETFRQTLAPKIDSILSRSQNKKLWDGAFVRPINAKTTALYGQERFYKIDGHDAGTSIHDGLDLAATKQAIVRAANSGVVLFSGELGIYGQTVIIDHGFGLTSIYGHLSSISVSEQEAVTKGSEIARSGATGLAGGDHLHYEVRLAGIPVSPIEWWDATWMRDRLDKNIQDTKIVLGVTTPEG